jgi:hypothetical protein
MKITIIPSDKTIIIDNQPLLDIQQDISWIPSDVNAVQWYDTWGEVEYTDTRDNLRIEELGIYEQAIIDYNNEIQRIQDELIAIESTTDYWGDLRYLRNKRLANSDWTQLSDTNLTEEEIELWRIYRQELRNLPDNIIDPKPLVLEDTDHEDWPVPPK